MGKMVKCKSLDCLVTRFLAGRANCFSVRGDSGKDKVGRLEKDWLRRCFLPRGERGGKVTAESTSSGGGQLLAGMDFWEEGDGMVIKASVGGILYDERKKTRIDNDYVMSTGEFHSCLKYWLASLNITRMYPV